MFPRNPSLHSCRSWKKAINHDCYVYKLKFVENPFKLSIGQHFRIVETVRHSDNGEPEEVIRKYTPISPCKEVFGLTLRRTLTCLSRYTGPTRTSRIRWEAS